MHYPYPLQRLTVTAATRLSRIVAHKMDCACRAATDELTAARRVAASFRLLRHWIDVRAPNTGCRLSCARLCHTYRGHQMPRLDMSLYGLDESGAIQPAPVLRA